MNWTRIVLAGVVAGVVAFFASFVMHGILLADTYKKYTDAFSQVPVSPLKFLAVALAVNICVAILFGRTRASWAAGWKGGVTFGLFLGIASFFANFYNPLVIGGFPYYLSWCWGGIGVINGLLTGAVLGAIVPRE